MGLTMRETLSVPFSFLLDLIAIQQIKVEGADRKLTTEEAREDFMRMLSID